MESASWISLLNNIDRARPLTVFVARKGRQSRDFEVGRRRSRGRGRSPAAGRRLFSVKSFAAVHLLVVVSKKMSSSVEQSTKEYAEFEEKIKRTVLLDNLSPEVTAAILRMALEQFGNVVNVEFVINFTIPYDLPQCALVEMEDAEMAGNVIKTMKSFPFMISGMPRPVRAHPAKAEMFADRPALPGRKIKFHWADKSDPDFEVGERLKRLCSRHSKENLALVQLQLEEEEKLAKQQEDMVQSNYKKYEMIEILLQDGFAARLAHHYGVNLSEE